MFNNLAELSVALASWQVERLSVVEPVELQNIYKLRFEIEYYREAVIYRFIDLVKPAITLFETGDYLAAVVLARSAQETISVLLYINLLMESAIERRDVANLKSELKKLILGKSNDPLFPERINILKLIDKADKITPGFRDHYDILSEYAHPNLSGTFFIFAKPIQDPMQVIFGRFIRGEDCIKTQIESSLLCSSLLYLFCQSTYSQMSTPFQTLCIDLHDHSELYPMSPNNES